MPYWCNNTATKNTAPVGVVGHELNVVVICSAVQGALRACRLSH